MWPLYVDPFSKLELKKIVGDDGVEFMQSSSGVKYEIIKGIPRILKDKNNYAEAFGDQWLKWRETQLDSHTGTSITRKRLERCLGQECLQTLNDSKTSMQVLEVGCGAGRFSEVLLSYPSVNLTSMDLSQAVEANNLNCPQDKRHRIVQADIINPPFINSQYDVVVCLGVIQHTVNPELTISKLLDQVKPGGWLIIDHYTFEIRRYTKLTGNLLRPIIKRLSSVNRMRAVEFMVDIFFPLHKMVRWIPYAQYILSRFSPIVTYFHAYPELHDKFQREWSILDTHDGMTDWFKHLRSVDQINECLQMLGAKSISTSLGGIGVESRCKKSN